MTCIVAIVEDGKVHIGGDSAGVAGLSITLRKDPKVFINGEFIMGFTSSFRMGQLLAHSLKVPTRDSGQDVYEYMVNRFVPAVRNCLKDGGVATKHHDAEEGGRFIVGYAGRLFMIDSDYQVAEPVDNYMAVGCGDHIALGSLFSTEGKKPKKRIQIALEAAEKFSGGVRGPFLLKEL